MKNYYSVLGVKNFASINEVKTAYRKLAKKFHPDVNQGDKFFEKKFIEVQEAYETLKEEDKRLIYDQNLKSFLDSNSRYVTNQEDIPRNNNKKKEAETKANVRKPDNRKYHNLIRKQWSKLLNSGYFSFPVIFIAIILTFSRSVDFKKRDNLINNQNSNLYIPDYKNTNKTQNSTVREMTVREMIAQLSREQSNITEKKAVYLPREVSTSLDKDKNYEKLQSENESIMSYSNKEFVNIKNNQNAVNDNRHPIFQNSFFTIGSTKEEVLSVQGTPARVSKFSSS